MTLDVCNDLITLNVSNDSYLNGLLNGLINGLVNGLVNLTIFNLGLL